MVIRRRVPEPEFSYKFAVEDLEKEPLTLDLEADEAQREALAKRLNVTSVDGLSAHIVLERTAGHVITVNGKLKADITQACVVTLEPIVNHIEDAFDAFFSEQTDAVSFAKAKRDKIVENQDPEAPFLDEKDDPERIVDGMIDLGEVVTQYLSLSIDPYPRKEGAKHHLSDDDEEAVKAARKTHNPFAKLEGMKKMLEDKS